MRVLRRLFLTIMLRGRRQLQGKPSRFGPWLALGLSLGFFSLISLVALTFSRDLFLFAGLLHSLAFLMVGMNLATTGGQLLFNPEEADVLLHRPIEPRSLLSAKLQTIGLFSLAMAVAINLGGLVIGVLDTRAGWRFLPAHFVSLVLEVLFTTGFIVLAYNLCLRWFGRERLDNFMTAVQVLLAVGIMAGGQIVPRLLRGLDFAHLELPAWMLIFPPVWFAALDAVLTGNFATQMLLPAGIGVGATALVVWLGVVRLASTYEQGLETLNEADSSAPAGGHGRGIARLLRRPGLRRWVSDPVEAAAFRLTLANLGRSRGVKLRVYPMLAQLAVIPIVMFAGGGKGMAFMEPYIVAYLGFFLAMVPVMVLEALRLSEDHEATELFRQAPLVRPTALFHGTRKAIIAVLCLPGLLVGLSAGAFLLGDARELVLVVPGLLFMQVFSLLPTLFKLYLPFAEPIENVSRGLKTTLTILSFQMLSFGLAGIAGWLWGHGGFWWMLLAEAVLVWVVNLGLRALIRERRFSTN
jgi:ABC-2 type transport system permease protein